MARAFVMGTGRPQVLGPALLLVLVVLLPTLCLLWFMQQAIRNDRAASRDRLAEAYRVQMLAFQKRLDQHWQSLAITLQHLGRDPTAPGAQFAKAVQSNLADSILIFADDGTPLYPAEARPIRGRPDTTWTEATRLEQRRNWRAAAAAYAHIAVEAMDKEIGARARQAEARCLRQLNDVERIRKLVREELSGHEFAYDVHGRLIVPNLELMALEMTTNRSSAEFRELFARLAARLNDYGQAAFPPGQRRFLMRRLLEMDSAAAHFPTLGAEELAAAWLESHEPQDNSRVANGILVRDLVSYARLPDRKDEVWVFGADGGRVVALFDGAQLMTRLAKLVEDPNLSRDVRVCLSPPGRLHPGALAVVAAGDALPQWTIALSIADDTVMESVSNAQQLAYLWIGILVVTVAGVFTVFVVMLMWRQAAVARMKNDLVAAVSHELKTPLASMRLLVDTLLEREQLEPGVTRDYLQLISRENVRLSRLIDNFLTFSRLEQSRFVLQPELMPGARLVERAAAAVQERFDMSGCNFRVDVEAPLPDLWADDEAITTALVNLLDNAFKYSGPAKQITLSARAENGTISFSVRDNGIGVPAREQRKIFKRYYQVDRRLSSGSGGCGLGLAIVQLIVEAHHGQVELDSRQGAGSTFTVVLPAIATVARTGRKAA